MVVLLMGMVLLNLIMALFDLIDYSSRRKKASGVPTTLSPMSIPPAAPDDFHRTNYAPSGPQEGEE
jgi:hypothetical protein